MHATALQSVDAASPARAGVDRPEFPITGESHEAPSHSRGLLHDLITTVPLVAADLAAVLGSLAVALQAATTVWPSATLDSVALAAGFTCAISLANLGVGLYPGIGLTLIAESRLSSMAAVYIASVFLIVSLLLQAGPMQPIGFVIAATCCLLLGTLPLTRALVRAVFGRFRWWSQPALIVGEGAAVGQVYSFLNRHCRLGLRPVTVVGDWNAGLGGPSGGARWRDHRAAWLVVAMPRRPQDEVRTMIRALGRDHSPRTVISRLDGSPSLWNRAGGCLDWPAGHEQGRQTPLRSIKRMIDLAVAIVAVLLLLPLFLVLALLIKVGSPGPVLFRQERVGLHGRRFMVWKFRTMICDGDRVLDDYLAACPQRREQWNRDHKLPDDPRVTLIGRWLRKTSLDELPQLWNVLRGEMSLVGPRPILVSEIADFGGSFEAFSSVPPGITGLWQVSGRNQTTYAEHIELDRYYALNWSLWLDLYILVLTVRVVLFRHGAY